MPLAPAQGSATGWERLHTEHALVLSPVTGDIRMANPFPGVLTAHRAQAAGRWRTGAIAG
jgi:hypothetical protein